MPRRSDLGKQIIAKLLTNPELTRSELAKATGKSLSAIQKQLRTLLNKEDVVETFTVSDKWKQNQLQFFITIETRSPLIFSEGRAHALEQPDPKFQQQLCKDLVTALNNQSEILFADIAIVLGGQWDIILSVFCDNPDHVGRFVTQVVRSNRNVSRTSTSWRVKKSL